MYSFVLMILNRVPDLLFRAVAATVVHLFIYCYKAGPANPNLMVMLNKGYLTTEPYL